MPIPLFDVQTGFGGGEPKATHFFTAEELREEMRRVDIARALVRITPENFEYDILESNRRLYAACAGGALTPCPVVIPNTAGDLPTEEEQVETAVAQGAGAVWIRPAADGYLLAEWVTDRLFTALQARRLPVLCLERMVTYDQLAAMAGRYPELPFILAEVGYRSQRTIQPLLEAYSNIYLSTGNNYIVYRGIETLCARVGAERLLFGTGYPVSEPMSAIALLMYADIAEEERALIGAGNLQRLIEGVAR